jgi:two-component system cell cycle sensor histidine kinase/response regulator CckA
MTALVAVSVFTAARLGYAFALPDGRVLFWPPAGLILALLASSKKRVWPLLLAAAFTGGLAADLSVGNAPAFSIFAAVVNCAESLLAAWALTYILGTRVTISSLRSVIVLVAGAAIATNSVTSALGAALLSHSFHTSFGLAWTLWGVGDGVGILVITPAVLTWMEAAKQPHIWKSRRTVEASLLFAMIAASARYMLGSQHGWLVEPNAYMTFPLLFWAALRFGPAGAATGSLIVSSILIWNTSQGHGLFAVGLQSPIEQSIQIYAYVGCASLSSLVPAVILRERRTAERALLESQQRYQTVTDAARDAIVAFDQDNLIQFANPGVYKIFGYTPAEIEGQSFTMLMPESLREHHRAAIRHFIETEQRTPESLAVERLGLHRNGQVIPLDVSFGVSTKDNRYTFTAVMRDVTERKAAEQALRESTERYRLLFEGNPHPMWVYDTNTLSFLEVNDVAVAQYGYSREEFLAMKITAIRPPEEVPKLLDHLTRLGPAYTYTGQWRHRRKDGTLMDVEVFAHAMKLAGADVSLVVAQNVTEARALTKQVAALQKFDAIGKLAGGIAHDFNNLLGVIMGFAELALDDVEPGSAVHDGLERILDQTQRATRLTRQLLAFARQQILERRDLSLNDVIKESLGLFHKVIGEHVEVQTLLAPGLSSVRADHSQMEQVLLNLVVNARDAMPRGGRLLVETGEVVLDEEFCRMHIWAHPGQYVRLSVSDTGTGMDALTLEHIFDPFFTTKEVGKGTGLGLSTVYGVIKQHDGFIHAYSELGHGTTFRVYLPAGAARAEPIGKAPELRTTGGTETILMIEDHDALREIAQKTLEGYGYTVLTASNGQEAVQLFRTNGERIDLVVSDVVMPKMSGPAAAAEMRALRPNLRVLFTTGYSAELQLISDANRIGMPILQKPYSPKALAARVREALNQAILFT